MARALLFLLTVLLCNLLPSAPLDAQSPGEQALSTLRESLERNAPALEGTEEEKGRIDALTAFFEPLEVPLERANVSTGPTVHTFAEYLIAHPEALPLDSLVVVVPLDAPVESILLGARLAAHPSVAERGPSVIFLGGADREEVGPTWLSSRISGLPGVQQVAILNFSRLERGMLVEAGTAGDVAPFYMLQAARDLSDRELRFALAGNKLQLARLGLAMPEEPLGALLSRGVPAVQLTNNDDPGVSRWISRRLFGEDRPVSPERMVEALIGLREELPSQGPWERNYVALQAGPVYLLLGETALLAVGGVPLISMLLYGTFKPWRVRRYARIMGKNFRQLPLLFGAVAVYLLISTTLIEAIAVARVFPSLVTYAPAITFSAKLLITITLFGLSHEALRKALFSRNSSFYSGWALFLQLLALLVLLVSNLALSFYFVWTLTLTFLFGFVGYPWLKRLIFFFALLPPLAFVFSILAPGETIMAGALINSPTHATFLIALFLLPYLLMLFRLDLLRRAVPGRRMAPHTVARRTATAVLGALGLGVLLFYDPFGADRPVPVSLEEQLAEEHTLSITAPRPLVGGRVRVAGVERAEWQERTRSLELPLDRAPEVFEVELQRREFLRRTQLRYTITTPDRLESVTITLSGVPELTILESRFPVIEGDGETTLIVGANPPNPLLVELVVEGNQAPDLMLDAKLRRTVSQIGITSDEPVSVNASARVRQLLEVSRE
ncbi:MAG: hypothetical protein ACOCWS_02700 [Alkalispirochaetaceae bacterium]